jgi:HPt (histidine-containing phosphotransfer) domain-containing protein
MDDHLTKPFSRDELGRVSSRWLTPTSARFAPGSASSAGDEGRDEAGDVLDRAALDQIGALSGAAGSGLVARVITAYLDTSVPLGEVIAQAWHAADAAAVARAAHRLKSSSAQLGVLRVARACEELERLARAGDLERCEPLVACLGMELDRAREQLEAIRGEER